MEWNGHTITLDTDSEYTEAKGKLAGFQSDLHETEQAISKTQRGVREDRETARQQEAREMVYGGVATAPPRSSVMTEHELSAARDKRRTLGEVIGMQKGIVEGERRRASKVVCEPLTAEHRAIVKRMFEGAIAVACANAEMDRLCYALQVERVVYEGTLPRVQFLATEVGDLSHIGNNSGIDQLTRELLRLGLIDRKVAVAAVRAVCEAGGVDAKPRVEAIESWCKGNVSRGV